MALFVPILRLLLLFLNVYDSYKTLKLPPPSARNGGRPSVRALTQRKRDMKGCLAVWIVWVALCMYERSVESFTSLLVPFYDEFKSIALLFLILTRARGAEPIYLHLIRPMVKPYANTIDGVLEVMLMTGDFFFAMAMYPIQLSIAWWRKKFHTNYEVCDTDQETESTTSSDQVNTSELPSSFVASMEQSGTNAFPAVIRKTSSDDSIPEYPPRPVLPQTASRRSTCEKETKSTSIPVRKSTKEDLRKGSRDTLRRKDPAKVDRSQLEPNFFEPSRRRAASPARSLTAQSDASNATSGLEPNFFNSPPQATPPQVWYPPKQAYVDEGLETPDPDAIVRPSDHESAALAREHAQYEEWRQYPAFPSAYPPTPLPMTTKLTVATAAYAAIVEEEAAAAPPLQDFHQSLPPPREPLNPSHAGDSSDYNPLNTPGNSNLDVDGEGDLDEAEAEGEEEDSSMSADEYEEEDAFNITLRTPLKPLGSLRSQIMPQRMVPQVSVSSAFSVPSISTALTTSDGLSISRRNTDMSESSLSDSPVSQAPNTSTSPVIGRKRAAPRARPLHADNRVREVEDDSGAYDTSDEPNPSSQLASTLKGKKGGAADRRAPLSVLDSDTGDDAPTSSSNSQAGEVQAPPEEKRRKVTRAHPRATGSTILPATQEKRTSVRTKAKPHASTSASAATTTKASAPASSSQTQQRSKFLQVPAPSSKHTQRRPLQPTGSSTRRTTLKENDAVRRTASSDSAKESTSASDASMPPPPIPLKVSQSRTGS